MKWLLPLILIVGCAGGSVVPAPDDAKPKPVVREIAFADITEAIADAIPSSIETSDKLILVLDDLVVVKKLTSIQARQIKTAADIDSMRPLTEKDAEIVRGVK